MLPRLLPRLILESSKIYGLGFFDDHDLGKGCFVTQYGGEYVTSTDTICTTNVSTDAKIRNTQYVYLQLPNKTYSQSYDWERSSELYDCTSFVTQEFIVTTRYVKRGEEILVGYGTSYYERQTRF